MWMSSVPRAITGATINSGNAPSIVVYWNYENSTCRPPGSAASGSNGNGSRSQFNSGAIYRASYSPSDFCLFELDDPIPDAFEVYRVGWDRTDTAPPSVTGIHHPAGDEKSISFENDPTTITDYLSSTVNSSSTHIRIADWDLGTTEGGSSGSGLFNPQKRLVAVLTGGYAACGNNSSDWYGRIYKSWEGGGTAASRLKDWLDPTNSGSTAIDGLGLGSLVKYGTPVIDDSAGDGDGVIEPGESQIALTFTLQNSGTQPITGISATLSSLSPGVTVTQADSGFADLGASATGSNSTPYVISVGASHLCGDDVLLRLSVTSVQEDGSFSYALPTGPTCDVIPYFTAGTLVLSDSAGNNNGVAEPNETISLDIPVTNHGGGATGVGAVLSTTDPDILMLAGSISYPALGTGQTASGVSPFRFKIGENRTCGETIAFTLTVNSAEGSNQVPVSIVHPSDTQLADDFEGDFSAWRTQVGAGTNRWAIRTSANAVSGTHVVSFSPPQDSVEDVRLIAGPFTGASELQFRHSYNFEETFDGGVLEVSTNGGANWLPVISQITTGGYDATIDTGYSSPIAGRAAWTGSNGGMTLVTVDLAAYAGSSVTFAWRWTSDSSAPSPGPWEIDDVQVSGPVICEPYTGTPGLNGWMIHQ